MNQQCLHNKECSQLHTASCIHQHSSIVRHWAWAGKWNWKSDVCKKHGLQLSVLTLPQDRQYCPEALYRTANTGPSWLLSCLKSIEGKSNCGPVSGYSCGSAGKFIHRLETGKHRFLFDCFAGVAFFDVSYSQLDSRLYTLLIKRTMQDRAELQALSNRTSQHTACSSYIC